ncbi:MAG: EAL domain-containing protein [Pseudomonadota bacterium]
MIEAQSDHRLRLLYIGETSVPARTALRAVSGLDHVETVAELTDPELLPQHLAAWQPDLVLVDVGISESSAERYRSAKLMQLLEAFPTLALTSAEREQRGLRAVLHGAQHYLVVDAGLPESALRTAIDQCRKHHDFTSTINGRSELLAMLVEGLPDGALLCDRDGRIIRSNAVARGLLGLSREHQPALAWGRTFCAWDPASGDELIPSDRPIARAARGDRFTEQRFRHRDEQGAELVLSVSGHGLYNGGDELLGGILLFRDVTDDFQRVSGQTEHALFDPATGIANRHLFTEQLQQAIARAKRSQRTLGVLCIDLDRFQAVNDSLGHDAGDMLLDAVGGRLQVLLRQGDMLAQWGGDRFMVCVENLSSPRDAAAIAQKIIRGLAERFECSGSEIYIGASIGIALYPEAGDDEQSLIEAANQGLAEAKRQGGARLQFFAESAHAAGNAAELELGIRHALLRRELTLRYQPRVGLNDGRLMGLEALLRWQHPRFGLLPPARFLSLLESSGLIHSVGEWVVRTVCAQLHAWQQRYPVPDLTVTINLSPLQLEDGRLTEVVANAIGDFGLDPGCLEFELGDGADSLRRPKSLESLQALRALGVGVSLDHFGTHDISFAALDSTMISTFVLHQSLVQDLADNETHQRIVRAAIAMADGLQIEVAAEGVETHDQLEFLRSNQCTAAQGFFISRPMSRQKVDALLHTESLGQKLLSQHSAA